MRFADALAKQAGTRFIGRSDELHMFSAALAQSADSSPSILNFSGDSGFGKSTLLTECLSLAEADGALIALVDIERAPDTWNCCKTILDQLLEYECK